MPLAIEAFTSKDTAPSSTESVGDTSTQLFPLRDIATASMEEMQAEIQCLEQLEQCQQIKEKILTMYAKVSRAAAQEH